MHITAVTFSCILLQANKRLKEALDRQKVSRERNNHKGAHEKDLSGVGPRVRALVGDELDIMVSRKA